jgi:NitT/TauT family transport system substrate-binding protein/sulfonate transport system substrate-binding protein
MKKNVQAILAAMGVMMVAAPTLAADIPELKVGWTIPAEEAKYLMMKRPEMFPDLGKKYTIKWTQFQGTSPMIQAMRANVLNCSTMAPMSLAQGAIESGLKAYIVAQHVYEKKGNFTVYWAVKKDSPIKSAADLKGKVLGTNAYGSGVYFNLVLWLEKNGLDPKKDVKIVETGFPPMADAIRSGRIDLGTMVQPFALLAQEKGDLRELASQADVQTPQVQIFEGCSQEYTNAHPEVVQAYIKDLERAMNMVQADHSLAVAVTSEVTRAPAALLSKYLMTNKDFARDKDMKPNLDSIQKTWDLYYKAGFLSKALNINDFVRKDTIAPVK